LCYDGAATTAVEAAVTLPDRRSVAPMNHISWSHALTPAD